MAVTRSAGRAPSGGQARQFHRSKRYTSPPLHVSHALNVSYGLTTDLSDELALLDSDQDSQGFSSDSDSGPAEPDAGSRSLRPRARPSLQRKSLRSAGKRPQRRRSLRSISRNRINRDEVEKPLLSSMAATPMPLERTPPKPIKRTSPHRRGLASGSPSKQKRHDATLDSLDEKASVTLPNWLDPRISYDCWSSIFLYAASEGSTDCLATNWLVHAATTCKAFAEPALTALYRCPNMRTPTKAKRLASLLERDPVETLFNYRAKVEQLHIDIHIVPQTVLYQLIHHLLRLKELIIFTPMDQPPYRKLDTNVRWHYPEDVFQALAPSTNHGSNPVTATEKRFPTVLKSWEWSGRLIGDFVTSLGDLARIHQTPSFAHLTHVSFTNFQVPSLRDLASNISPAVSDREDGLVIEAVGRAISELKFLKHLTFESSTVMNNRLLSLLPKQLHHFELINCWEITSEDLAPFLQTHGSRLRTLTLLHNQSLNLAFLTGLADTCPDLQALHMNLSYYRHHDSINDSDPMYDSSLLPSQIPKWPPSLRLLNIENIRNWDQETAEMFLESLCKSSGELTNLRYLAIKLMLDIPWQSRAEIRNKWRLKMDRIFLRPFIPPSENRSLRGSASVEDASASRKRKRGRRNEVASPSRRSGRIADFQSKMDRGSRRPHRERPSYREPDTDDDEFEVSEESSDEDISHSKRNRDRNASTEGDMPIIQGLCNTVSILFDNQKPRELQFSMEDFLDNEVSEEEWNGDDDDDEDLTVVF